MKIHVFNSKVNLSDNNSISREPVKKPVPDKKEGKSSPANEGHGNSINTKSGTSATPKDRIDLNSKTATEVNSQKPPHDLKAGDSIEIVKNKNDITYDPGSISEAAKTAKDDSRQLRLAGIREKITDGYYNSPELIEKLAEILIDNFYLAGRGD